MGTKNNPGDFDCWANADRDEPMFVLLGRDVCAPTLVRDWVMMRAEKGLNTHMDAQCIEARQCANDMEEWRRAHPKTTTLKVVWADAALDRAIDNLGQLFGQYELPPRVVEAIQVGIDAIRTVKGES